MSVGEEERRVVPGLAVNVERGLDVHLVGAACHGGVEQ